MHGSSLDDVAVAPRSQYITRDEAHRRKVATPLSGGSRRQTDDNDDDTETNDDEKTMIRKMKLQDQIKAIKNLKRDYPLVVLKVTGGVAVKLSQESFDEMVVENRQNMTEKAAALRESIDQFKTQGVDVRNLLTDYNFETGLREISEETFEKLVAEFQKQMVNEDGVKAAGTGSDEKMNIGEFPFHGRQEGLQEGPVEALKAYAIAHVVEQLGAQGVHVQHIPHKFSSVEKKYHEKGRRSLSMKGAALHRSSSFRKSGTNEKGASMEDLIIAWIKALKCLDHGGGGGGGGEVGLSVDEVDVKFSIALKLMKKLKQRLDVNLSDGRMRITRKIAGDAPLSPERRADKQLLLVSAAMVALNDSTGSIISEMHNIILKSIREKQKTEAENTLRQEEIMQEEIATMTKYVEELHKENCNFSGLNDFIQGHASVADIVGSLDLSSNWNEKMNIGEFPFHGRQKGLEEGLVEALKGLRHVKIDLKENTIVDDSKEMILEAMNKSKKVEEVDISWHMKSRSQWEDHIQNCEERLKATKESIKFYEEWETSLREKKEPGFLFPAADTERLKINEDQLRRLKEELRRHTERLKFEVLKDAVRKAAKQSTPYTPCEKSPFTEVSRSNISLNSILVAMLGRCYHWIDRAQKYVRQKIPSRYRNREFEENNERQNQQALKKIQAALVEEELASVMSRWVISKHPPRLLHFISSLAYQHGLEFFVARWLILLCHVVAVVLPGLVPSAFEEDDDEYLQQDGGNTTTTTAEKLIPYALLQVCENVPISSRNAYIDPIESYQVVLFLAVAFAFVLNIVSPIFKQLGGVSMEAVKEVVGGLDGEEDGGEDDQEEELEEESPDAVEGEGDEEDDPTMEHSESMNHRSFYFLLQSTTLTLNFSQAFLWSSSTFSSLNCRVAHITTAPFLKPVVVPMFYCLNYLLDGEGGLLQRNPLTDSMVVVPEIFFSILRWTYGIFLLPLTAVFFADVLGGFLVPVLGFVVVYIFTAGVATEFPEDTGDKKLKPAQRALHFLFHRPEARFEELTHNKYQMDVQGWPKHRKVSATFAQLILRRLILYSVFTGFIAATALLPWYEGTPFGTCTNRFERDLRIGNGAEDFKWSGAYFKGVFVGLFWLFEPDRWSFHNFHTVLVNIFRWPKELSLVSQISLLLSIYTTLMEFLPLGWSMLMRRFYKKGWTLAHKKEIKGNRPKASKKKEDKKTAGGGRTKGRVSGINQPNQNSFVEVL